MAFVWLWSRDSPGTPGAPVSLGKQWRPQGRSYIVEPLVTFPLSIQKHFPGSLAAVGGGGAGQGGVPGEGSATLPCSTHGACHRLPHYYHRLGNRLIGLL